MSRARAAIEAMREPTEGQLKAITDEVMANLRNHKGPTTWERGYAVMISASLQEEGKRE